MEWGKHRETRLKLVEDEPVADVIYMTDIVKDSMKKRREELDPDQKEYFHDQASYWDEVAETARRQLDYALGQRAYAMTMLGMLPETGAFPE